MLLPADSLPRSRWGQPLLPGTFCLQPPAIRPCARPSPRPSLAHGSPCHAASRAPATPSCSRARRCLAVSPQAALTSTYSPAVKASVAAAGREAQAAGCLQVQPCHLVLGLMDACLGTAPAPTAPSPDASEMRPGRAGGKGCTLGALLEGCGLTREHVRTILSSEAGEHKGTGSSLALSDEAAQVLSHARRAARMQGVDVAQPGHLLYGLLQLPRHRSTNPLVALVEDAAVKAPGAAWATLQAAAFAPVPSEHTPPSVAASVDPPQPEHATSPATAMLLQLGQQSTRSLSLRELAQALSVVPSLHVAPGQDMIVAIKRAVDEKQGASQRFHSTHTHSTYYSHHSCSSADFKDLADWSELLTAAMAAGVSVPVQQSLCNCFLDRLNRLLVVESTLQQGLDLLQTLAWHDVMEAPASQHLQLHARLTAAETRLDDCRILAEALRQVPWGALGGRIWGHTRVPYQGDTAIFPQLLHSMLQRVFDAHAQVPMTLPFLSVVVNIYSTDSYLQPWIQRLQLKEKLQHLTEGVDAVSQANLGLRDALRLLTAAASSKASLPASALTSAAGVIQSHFRSHAFGLQEAVLAVTSLHQLRHDPGPDWLSGFLPQLGRLAPLMTPQQLAAAVHAAGSYPHSKSVVLPDTAKALLQATLKCAAALDASQSLALGQGLLGLGLRAAHCSTATTHSPSPSSSSQLLSPVLAMMAEHESSGGFVQQLLGLPDGHAPSPPPLEHRPVPSSTALLSVMLEVENSSGVVQKLLATPPPSPASQEHGAMPPASRALPSSTALLCQALTQQYFQQQQQQAATYTPTSDAQALTSTLMSWVAAAAAAAGSSTGAGVPDAAASPAAASALLSASLRAPLSPRQALLMAWGAAVLGLQPPDGWVEAMWERVRPVVQAGGGQGGGDMHGRGLLEGDRALLVWAFNALQQATTHGALLEAATLPPPSTSSPLALSSALWALAQTRPPPQPLASSPGTAAAAAAGPVAVPWQWMEQTANALTAKLSDAVAGGEQAGKEGGGVEAAEAEGCRFKACVSGLLSLGQLGYRLGGGGEEAEGAEAGKGLPSTRQAIRTRCAAIHAWAQQAMGSGEEGRAAAAVQAALAAVGV